MVPPAKSLSQSPSDDGAKTGTNLTLNPFETSRSKDHMHLPEPLDQIARRSHLFRQGSLCHQRFLHLMSPSASNQFAVALIGYRGRRCSQILQLEGIVRASTTSRRMSGPVQVPHMTKIGLPDRR